ncbi:MAG: hypothetical protein ACI3ZQ_10890, partial [Candidatus Cryptobacteroides sp.]
WARQDEIWQRNTERINWTKKGREEGRKEGQEEGAMNKAIETAKNFKDNGVDIELIAKCTGLSVEQVKEL